MILLDTRNRMIHIEEVYKGSLNSSQVRVGELFRAAIQRNAASIILAHNHPSGDPTPSPEDAALTQRCGGSGEDNGYLSTGSPGDRSEGVMFR